MKKMVAVETIGGRCLFLGRPPTFLRSSFAQSLLPTASSSPSPRSTAKSRKIKTVVAERISPRRHWTFSRSPSLSPSPFLLISSPTKQVTLQHFRTLYSGPDNDYQTHELAKSKSGFFVKWEIPWDGKTVILTITAFGLSFLFTGLAVSILFAQLGFRQKQLLDFDERSFLVFINQFLQTVIGTSVIKACIKSYSPLPRDLFNYDLTDPFSVSRGWLLWSMIGTICGAAAVVSAGSLAAYINGEPLSREGQDALLQLLPLIGASGTSTALLLAVTGVLAPILEETLFRGFLMTSLTKWMPTSAAVILSAGAFALAHFTPGQAPQLFALGVVLGLSYSKSGNLLTPIVIHGMWNSGVLLLLTVLRTQGYDIQDII